MSDLNLTDSPNTATYKSYPQCGFCAAEHPKPNEPGACVMFWQSLADGYRGVVDAARKMYAENSEHFKAWDSYDKALYVALTALDERQP